MVISSPFSLESLFMFCCWMFRLVLFESSRLFLIRLANNKMAGHALCLVWSSTTSRSAVKPYLTYLSFHLCVFGIVESRKPMDKINNNFVSYVASKFCQLVY